MSKKPLQLDDTISSGLSSAQAVSLLRRYGPNDISESHNRHGIRIFVSQFSSSLQLLLVGSAVIALFLGEQVDAIVILAIVFISGVLGFFQEFKAEQALRQLRTLVTVRSRVIRDGKLQEIDSRDLVPGDYVHLALGDVIPVDILLREVSDFSTNESSLTGESLAVGKHPSTRDKHDKESMAFMGTSVASGSAEGVVVATGYKTELGKTAGSLSEPEPPTEFERGIKEFGGFLLKITFVMTLFILVANAVLGKSFFDSLLFAIALAVGITPEVLPVLMTITLSKGAMKLAKMKVITKTLSAVENLGNIDVLCCDKTGTLTEGEVALVDSLDANGRPSEAVLHDAVLCSTPHGNDVDKAIRKHAHALHASAVSRSITVQKVNDFDFERRRMSVVIKQNRLYRLVVKGAAESVLEVCRMTPTQRKHTVALLDSFEAQGYRVLAVASKKIKSAHTGKEDEADLALGGFLLFSDPAKSTVAEALATLQKLHVDIKIISGDSERATRKVCEDVGLTIAHNRIITGDKILHMRHHEFEKCVRESNIFARVTPDQKHAIVLALSRMGHVVGFLGDGINDAPALKAADVGISVDTGAEIAKGAADIILLKKSLRVLAAGIIEGRKIFANIMKYIFNTVSANFGNMFTVAGASLFLNFIPLLPGQILLNNLISDIPMLTVATDTVDEASLERPRRWNVRFIARFMVFFGILSTVFDLLLIIPLAFVFKASPEVFRTAWFIESALSEIIVTFAIRTKLSIFVSKPSRLLLFSSLATVVVTIGITYLVFGNLLFGFVPLPASILLFIGVILIAYLAAAEVMKRYFFRRFQN